MTNKRLETLCGWLIVKPSLTAFVLGFAWALCAMLVSRYWVVPNFIPSQDGHILGDPVYYHELALHQVYAVQTQGWQAFQLHFEQQGNVGITSLLYLITPSPILVVILNALLHATACAAVTRLLLTWFSPGVAILACLPLLFSFVNIFWLAQINKESYVIAGCALFFMGYILCLKDSFAARWSMGWLALAVAAVLLIYIPRPHMNQMLLLGLAFTTVLVMGVVLAKKQYKVAGLCMLQSLVLMVALAWFSQGGIADSVNNMIAKAAQENKISQALEGGTVQEQQVVPQNATTTDLAPAVVVSSETTTHTESSAEASTINADTALSDRTNTSKEHNDRLLGQACYELLEPQNWQPADWLPAGINARIKALADLRCHNHELHDVQENAMTKQSIADVDVEISSVADMLAYAPRGLQLGFFGPLPSQWPDNSFLKSFFYTIVPAMMVFFYVAMGFATIWIVRTRAWLSLPLFTISLVPLWILGISNSFLGSLFRYRHPIWIILFCFCTAALLTVTVFKPKKSG